MMSHPHHAKVTPKFCKQYASVGKAIQSALSQYREEVSSGAFPSTAYSPYRQARLEGFAEPYEGNMVTVTALIRPLQAGYAAYRPCGPSMHLRSLVLAYGLSDRCVSSPRCAFIPNLKTTPHRAVALPVALPVALLPVALSCSLAWPCNVCCDSNCHTCDNT